MRALLANRAAWRQQQAGTPQTANPATQHQGDPEPGDWHFTGYGHANNGERLLALSAAAPTAEECRVARDFDRDEGEEP